MQTSTTVLLVDDNPLFRETLHEIIKLLRPSWRVVEAGNGHEAIELAQAKSPDVILLDYNMPVMSGYDVAVTLQRRADTSGIPLILMTSDDTDNPTVNALRLLCRAVLFKPFSLRDLERILEHLFLPRVSIPVGNYANRPVLEIA